MVGLMNWKCCPFDELSRIDIHDLFAARQEVFVVEQDCVYLDLDGLDAGAVHLLGRVEGELAAYARILAPGVRFSEPSIGRILTTSAHRGQGAGRGLVTKAIAVCEKMYLGYSIRISAQRYLEKFYSDLGFVCEGAPYEEDGIPHIEMLRPSS